MTSRAHTRQADLDGVNSYPIWSRDGRLLTFSRGTAQAGPLSQVAADGSGQASVLISDQDQSGQKVASSWPAIGGQLLYQFGSDVFVRDAQGARHAVLTTPAIEREARFAPSGPWFAYRSNETGRDEVYVQSYPLGSGKWQISTEGSAQPMWNPNGKELFYKAGNRLMVVPVSLEPTFKPGVPQLLFEVPLPERAFGDPSRYAVSPDGQRFLVTTTEESASTVEAPVHVVLNWRPIGL
jgi:Tol biopolymer transport system component